PKAIAGANRIREINSDVAVEPEVADVNHSNIERFISDADIVIDGTDNFATRYLINDACVKHDLNWVYGAAVGSYGVTMTIRPRETPCLRCIFPEAPPAASAPTCDTAGVIMPIISIVASVQVTEALKLMTGKMDDLHKSLMQFDVWRNEWRKISIGEPLPDCPTCGLGEYETLNAEARDFAAVMCGRHAVQISPSGSVQIDLAALRRKLELSGDVKANEYLLRFRTGEYELTVFQDARSIIRGTDDIATARSLYSKYVGN
ncbi:MAG TPA: ThiF family adenylyltransferase, partial [Pyrinomonadaceae bacterium]|nr:ThiF family adenylyltransferase [Pyrinomonadaceae bacterium]